MTIDRLPSGSYRARVHIGGGKYKSVTGKDKKDVQFRAAKLESEVEELRDKEANPYESLTVKDALDRYIEAKKGTLSPKTYAEYKVIARIRFPSLHSILLYELTQEQIQIAVGLEAASHSPKTVRNAHGLLSSTIKMFRPNFVLTTLLPKKVKTDIVIPTEADVIALLKYTHDTDIEVPFMLAAICGLRMSEVLGLRWSAIDLEGGTLRVCAAKVLDENRDLVEKSTKTTAGTRTLKLLPEAVEVLKRHSNDSEFVTQYSANQIKYRYEKALVACCEGRHYTFHELRHYACSVMVMLGIPTKYIADYLGHETEDMVRRVYAHIMSDKKDDILAPLMTYYAGVFSKCKNMS